MILVLAVQPDSLPSKLGRVWTIKIDGLRARWGRKDVYNNEGLHTRVYAVATGVAENVQLPTRASGLNNPS